MNERKSKNVVIIALCLTLIFMGVGFAALSQNLTINATATVSGKWDVKFGELNDTTATGINTTNTLNQGRSLTASLDEDKLIGTVKFDLVKPGDKVQYTATIVNNGNIAAQFKTFGATFANDYIERSVTVNNTEVVLGDDGTTVTAPDKLILDEGESATVIITYTFKDVDSLPPFNTDTTEPADGTNDVYQVSDTLTFGFVQQEAA